MPDLPASPSIRDDAWGRVEVEGQPQALKDAKLYPGGARAWDWGETGTRHRPGVQPADAEELLDHGAAVIVLSRGRVGALQVPADTVRALEARGAEVIVLSTAEAIRRYNELAAEGEAVGALIHSTC